MKIAELDQSCQNIMYKLTLEFIRYIGRYIIWVGLSRSKNGVALLYAYNTETGELKELEEKRVCHNEWIPAKIHPLGSQFYYTGRSGKIIRIGLNCNS